MEPKFFAQAGLAEVLERHIRLLAMRAEEAATVRELNGLSRNMVDLIDQMHELEEELKEAEDAE